MVKQDQVTRYAKKAGLTFLGYAVSDFVGEQLPVGDKARALIKAVAGAGIGIAAPTEFKSVGVGVGADALTDAYVIMRKGNSESSPEEDMGGVI